MSRRLVASVPVFESSVDEPFYPEVTVMLGDLTGPEGNAFSVLGRVQRELRRHGIDPSEYVESAKGGDYAHLLFVTRTWVRVLETGDGL